MVFVVAKVRFLGRTKLPADIADGAEKNTGSA
jgi:hypothetical protein